MTSLKGDLRSIMGTPFGGVGHAVLIFSRVTRAAFNSDSVVLQLHDRIEMPEEADGKFQVDGLDPGPIRVELEGGTVHNHGWNIDLPDEGTWSLADLVDAQVDWSPAVIGRAEAAARESRDHADRAEVAAARVGTAEQVGTWASEASASASASASARSAAQTARNASQSARDAAEGHADRAATSESNAAASESAAKQSETNAGDYAAVATTAATEAVDAMESASDAATAIGDSVNAAAGHADRASQYESGAAAYAQNASDAAERVGTAEQVGTWAQQAQDAADRIGTAETVEDWVDSARDSASTAAQSETKAKEYRDDAFSAASSTADELRGDLINIAGEASNHATESSRSAARAKTSETNAATHEANSLSAAERAEFAAEETIQQVEGDFATRNYVDDSRWERRYILANEDLNLVTTPGVYQIPYGSTMSSLVNRPIGYSSNGFLIVYASLGTVFQVLTQNTPRGSASVKRHSRSGIFGEWEPADGATQIFHYSDYNDAIIEGDYDIDTYSKARDVANRPPEVPSSLRLSVRKIGGGRIYQLITGISPDGMAGKWERRRATDSTWSEWQQIYTDVSKDWVDSRIEEIGVTPKTLDNVVTVGDSQVGATYAWANKLAGISGLTVVNRGVGGYTPDEALIEAGAWVAELSQDVELPPSTDVPVVLETYPVLAKNRTRAWIGDVSGSSVELKYLYDMDTFALRNRGTSTLSLSAGAKWTPGNYRELPDHRRIVWFGGNAIRNGLHGEGQTVLQHVQTAYSQAIEAWGDTTIVCGYVPAHGDVAGRDVANALNAWLERVVPTQFLDIRKRLQNDAEIVLGRGLTAPESQDISDGYLPKAMYQSDLVHLTEEVHVRIAEIVSGFPHGASPQVSIRSNSSPVVSLTGVGSPEGKLAAGIGSTYVDTAAANGAIRWIKASGSGNTGWRVEYGDTGWRNVTGLLMNGWTADQVLIRRQNNTVTLSALNLSSTEATSGVLISLPGAFHTPKTFVMVDTPTGTRPAFWNMSLQLTVSDYSNFGVSTYASTQTVWQLESDKAWPATLPGTPA